MAAWLTQRTLPDKLAHAERRGLDAEELNDDMLPYQSPEKKTMLRAKFKPRHPQRQGSGCSCPWPCTAQQKPTLLLDLATERAHMGQPHGTASQGTAQPGVRVHKSTKLQAAHESCSLAGSVMNLISLLQPLLFPIRPRPWLASVLKVSTPCLT